MAVFDAWQMIMNGWQPWQPLQIAQLNVPLHVCIVHLPVGLTCAYCIAYVPQASSDANVSGGQDCSLYADVAYKCKGPTQKNAAIAVARLAHDEACMQRIRELHGLEIIYQYVKP